MCTTLLSTSNQTQLECHGSPQNNAMEYDNGRNSGQLTLCICFSACCSMRCMSSCAVELSLCLNQVKPRLIACLHAAGLAPKRIACTTTISILIYNICCTFTKSAFTKVCHAQRGLGGCDINTPSCCCVDKAEHLEGSAR